MARRAGKESFTRKLGRRIRFLRVEAGITQEKLAWEIDLAKSSLSMIESGKRLPSLAVLVEIAHRLGVYPADVLAVDGDVPRFRVLEALRRDDDAGVRAALRQLKLVQ